MFWLFRLWYSVAHYASRNVPNGPAYCLNMQGGIGLQLQQNVALNCSYQLTSLLATYRTTEWISGLRHTAVISTVFSNFSLIFPQNICRVIQFRLKVSKLLTVPWFQCSSLSNKSSTAVHHSINNFRKMLQDNTIQCCHIPLYINPD